MSVINKSVCRVGHRLALQGKGRLCRAAVYAIPRIQDIFGSVQGVKILCVCPCGILFKRTLKRKESKLARIKAST